MSLTAYKNTPGFPSDMLLEDNISSLASCSSDTPSGGPSSFMSPFPSELLLEETISDQYYPSSDTLSDETSILPSTFPTEKPPEESPSVLLE